MRDVWSFASARRRLPGVVIAGALAVAGMGCHQHYYYYGDSCPPAATAVPSSVRTGPVCDVPVTTVEGGTTLADGSTRSTVVTGATSSSASSRVVVSEPAEPAKVAWRRHDPDEGVATTSTQGTITDGPVNR